MATTATRRKGAGWAIGRLASLLAGVAAFFVVPLARLTAAVFRYLSQPVQAGALFCFVFALSLLGVWTVLIIGGLEGEVRPSPVELARFASDHSGIFVWTGVAWFAVHALAVPVVVALFMVHADSQRPALWLFTIFFSLALVLWTLFGALSIPLGASAGPQYGDAMRRANLDERETVLWNAKCEASPELEALTGLTAAALAEACRFAADSPALLSIDSERARLDQETRLNLEQGWVAAQDTWVIRKVSDGLYFGGNGLYMLSMLFFCVFAVSSPVIRTFSVTTAAASGVCCALGFLAFWTSGGDAFVIGTILTQVALLMFIGADLWPEKAKYTLAVRQPDTRPVRLLRRDVPVRRDEMEWTYGLEDVWYRNRQISNTYARLGYQLARAMHASAKPGDPLNANWFHFGVWASRSVGERIARPDLTGGAVAKIEREFADFHRWAGNVHVLSEGLAEGNRLVFGDTAQMALCFLETFAAEEVAAEKQAAPAANAAPVPGATDWGSFESTVRAWPEREGYADATTREQLFPAFRAYYDAMAAPTGEERALLILLGNVLLVRFEQARLQQYVEDATSNFLRLFLVFIYPASAVRIAAWTVGGTKLVAQWAIARARKKPFSLRKQGIALEDRWHSGVAHAEFWVFTRGPLQRQMARLSAQRILLKLGTRKPEALVVGRPLGFPEKRNTIDVRRLPELKSLWSDIVRDPDEDPWVDDYRDINDRLDYIVQVFLRWQQAPSLRDEPFSAAERRRERLISVTSIEPDFDAGLPRPYLSRGEASTAAALTRRMQ